MNNRIEEKGIWVEFKEERNDIIIQTNTLKHKHWPEALAKKVAVKLLETCSTIEDEKKKIELFFEAKAYIKKEKLYKLYFKGVEFNFDEKDKEYIRTTISQAKDFIETGNINFN